MAQRAEFGPHPGARMHGVREQIGYLYACSPVRLTIYQLHASIRLSGVQGGPSLRIDITNDTGSSVQTVLPQDVEYLNYDPDVHGGGFAGINTAAGVVHRQRLYLDMQIVDTDGRPFTSWYQQLAVVGDPHSLRLSGEGMRNHLYFATSPGNAVLYVAVKKHGLMSLLPNF